MYIMYESDALCHHGIKGMKWGRRKQRVSTGTRRSSSSSKKAVKTQAKKNKILTDSRKQTLKAVGKTALKVAGSVAATAALGYVGSMAFSELSREYNIYKKNQAASNIGKSAREGDLSGIVENTGQYLDYGTRNSSVRSDIEDLFKKK